MTMTFEASVAAGSVQVGALACSSPIFVTVQDAAR